MVDTRREKIFGQVNKIKGLFLMVDEDEYQFSRSDKNSTKRELVFQTYYTTRAETWLAGYILALEKEETALTEPNPFGKELPNDDCYMIWQNSLGEEWRVLRTYTHPVFECYSSLWVCKVRLYNSVANAREYHANYLSGIFVCRCDQRALYIRESTKLVWVHHRFRDEIRIAYPKAYQELSTYISS